MNHKKELLWSLWVNPNIVDLGHVREFMQVFGRFVRASGAPGVAFVLWASCA